jgi:hypothetical protein
MKTFYTFLGAMLVMNMGFAKTYTLGSGKWNDAKIWDKEYAGATVKAEDVVIITGQVTVTEGIVVNGTLQIEKGASMVGMKDLVITKTGTFVNNGNTVMKRIINEGTINNNLLMEAMVDFDNKGKIENNNNVVAGNNFDNYSGSVDGKGGAYYVNNTIHTSPDANFSKNVDVFYGNAVENMEAQGGANAPMMLVASLNGSNQVVLSVSNVTKGDVSKFDIEKSVDGKNYQLLGSVKNVSDNGTVALNYTDSKLNGSLTYYKVKAIAANGAETVLPVATVKAPVNEMAADTEN